MDLESYIISHDAHPERVQLDVPRGTAGTFFIKLAKGLKPSVLP